MSSKPKKLTVKQTRFVEEYVKNGGNGTKAALKAYDTLDYRTASAIACENFTKKNIVEEIEKRNTDTNSINRIIRDYYNYKKTEEYVRSIGTKHIYIIKSGRYYKIGIAKNVEARLQSIHTSNPNKVKVVYAKEVEKAREVEAHIHNVYNDFRHKLEWFLLNKKQLKEIMDYLEEDNRGYI